MNSEDEMFLHLFETQTLPLSEWNHRAHLKVAYLYLSRFPKELAIERVRAGIRAFNAAKGIEDTPNSGYHETLTQMWIRIIHSTLCEYGPAASADEFLEAQPQLTQKKLHRLFYSVARFSSPEAKISFLEPDLASFPSEFKKHP